MSDVIVTAARARLAAAFPAWRDATGQAHPTSEAKLPAYAVRVTYTGGERVAMGSALTLREGQIEVAIEVTTPINSEAGLHDLARQAERALLASPDDLGGTVWQMTSEGFEAEHGVGEGPVSRGDLILAIQTLE